MMIFKYLFLLFLFSDGLVAASASRSSAAKESTWKLINLLGSPHLVSSVVKQDRLQVLFPLLAEPGFQYQYSSRSSSGQCQIETCDSLAAIVQRNSAYLHQNIYSSLEGNETVLCINRRQAEDLLATRKAGTYLFRVNNISAQEFKLSYKISIDKDGKKVDRIKHLLITVQPCCYSLGEAFFSDISYEQASIYQQQVTVPSILYFTDIDVVKSFSELPLYKKELVDAPYNSTAVEAEAFLQEQEQGTYFIRRSSQPAYITVSLKYGSGVYHQRFKKLSAFKERPPYLALLNEDTDQLAQLIAQAKIVLGSISPDKFTSSSAFEAEAESKQGTASAFDILSTQEQLGLMVSHPDTYSQISDIYIVSLQYLLDKNRKSFLPKLELIDWIKEGTPGASSAKIEAEWRQRCPHCKIHRGTILDFKDKTSAFYQAYLNLPLSSRIYFVGHSNGRELIDIEKLRYSVSFLASLLTRENLIPPIMLWVIKDLYPLVFLLVRLGKI